MQTVAAYVKSELAAGRFAEIIVRETCGEFWLADRDYMPLAGKTYKNRYVALDAASAQRARASKAYWRTAA